MAYMTDGQATGQKQRSNGKETPIAHIGDDIMVLSVLRLEKYFASQARA